MRLLAFSVYDSKAEAFLRPIFAETRGLAVRSIMSALEDPQHDLSRFSADYELFYVGEFDQTNGLLRGKLESMGSILQYKQRIPDKGMEVVK